MTLGLSKMLQTEVLLVKSLSFQLEHWIPSPGHSQCNPHNSFCDCLSTQSQAFRHQIYYGCLNSHCSWKSQPLCTFARFIHAWKSTNYTDNLLHIQMLFDVSSRRTGQSGWERPLKKTPTPIYIHSAQLQWPLNFQGSYLLSQGSEFHSSWWVFIQYSLIWTEWPMKWISLQAKAFNKDRVLNRDLII